MHLDSDDVLEGCDALADTLAAARAALETLAATSLPFAAQARIQRQSTRAARAWVRAHADLSPLPQAGVAPVAMPAAAAAAPVHEPARDDAASDHAVRDTIDPLADLDLSGDLDDLDPLGGLALEGGDSLGELDDLGGLGDLEPLDQASTEAEPPPSSDEPLISFDEDDDDPDSYRDLGDGGPPLDDASLLIQFDEDPDPSSEDHVIQPASGSEDSFADLIQFDEADDDPDSVATPRPPPERVTTDGNSDQTLVTDLESLVQLQDLLAEDDGPGLAQTDERAQSPISQERALKPGAQTTLTAEDLGRLGFASGGDLLEPEGADADPASDTGSRPTPRVTSDEPPQPRVRVGGGRGQRGELPTIRDTDSQRRADRPAAAAIQINPAGGGSIINEPITLELGEADEAWDEPSADGFSIQVEEYEAEIEPLDEAEHEPMVELTPEPVAAAPELSDSELTKMLARAASAVEKGDLHFAIELYSDALDFDPDNVKAAVGRGLAWLDLADYARAMSDFKVAEEVAPNNAEVVAAIGKLYYDRKDYGRAVDYLDRAVQLDPKHAMAWCRRGISHYYRKDYSKAYNNLVEAEKLDPNIPNIRTYIGMVRKRMT